MKTLFSFLAVFFFASTSFAQHLWINDPQNWRGGQGTIEETKITYEPKGLFMQVDWEITFSAKGLNEFTENDTVEVVYNFTLPQGAVINDSWLWFNDSILKAMIIDRWSASQVYENIVNRRRDPSILYKNWGNNYELRIFPMAAKESRKVKISYLTPANWTQKLVNSHFLSQNLLVSKHKIEKLDIFAKLNPEWKNPVITGENDVLLEPITGDENGNTHYARYDFKQLRNDQKFVLNSLLKDGYYFKYFEQDNEKFYQLALNPVEGIDIREPQKVLFFIDYQKDNSDLTQSELLKLLKTNLTELLTDKDSFNILYHDFELQKASNSWIAGDSASIVMAIESLGDEPFVSYGNLPSLLASGITLAQQEAGSKIILLANSDKLSDTEAANELISDLLELMDLVLPIYIGDFQTKNYNYSWIKNVNYRGNEYFYRNLAKLTGGDYYHLFDGGTFSDCIQNIYYLATSETGLLDIHTTLDNGFCYGRYTNTSLSGNILSAIYLETGRYSGEFPFEIEVAGMYAGEIFSKKISIAKEEAPESDSLTATWWYGNEILEMENSPNSYSIINDIIDKSIDNRILSNYTAFLCLEPGMMGELDEIDDKNMDNRWTTGDTETDMPISAEIQETPVFDVNAYPNPFTDRVKIDVQLPEGVSVNDAQLEIYDLFGKRIKIFNVDEFNGSSEFTLSWDATDNNGNKAPKGTYIFICSTPEGRISKKLVLM